MSKNTINSVKIPEGTDFNASKHNNPFVGSILDVRTFNEVIEEAKTQAIPNRLFGDFWFEKEICVLFSDSNLGKSILAVQIADSISTGASIHSEFLNECAAQSVVYFDFELSDKQVEGRYSSDYQYHHVFSDNCYRVSINVDAELPEGISLQDSIRMKLREVVRYTGAKVIILDNLTYINFDNEKAKSAAPLMQDLKRICRKEGLSMLILAHTPKLDTRQPITKNSLAGSKMLMNFVDSAFAIGESYRDNGSRYLKQIKERATPKRFSAANVPIFHLDKIGLTNNFLAFEFLGFSTEAEHLHPQKEEEAKQLYADIAKLLDAGASIRATAKEVGISKSKVERIAKRLKEAKSSVT